MAQWLSWLERRPVTAKVESSSLFWVVSNELTSLVNCIWIWNLSSAGRASALQAEGHRFEPYRFHILKENGEIAQLARAHGSYPWCRWFKSSSRYYNEDCVLKKLVRSFFTQIYWLLLISSKEIIVLRSNLW